MNLPAFISERFVITVETGDDRRKVFQVLFQKSDGSLFVSFRYFKDVAGLLTLVTLNARTKYPTSVSLLDGGKVTGHKVKYSHHPDGRVHFSQDGKVRTVIQKKSIPLSEAEGHLFTVQLQGLKDFSELSAKEKQPLLSGKKQYSIFDSKDHRPRQSSLSPICTGSPPLSKQSRSSAPSLGLSLRNRTDRE